MFNYNSSNYDFEKNEFDLSKNFNMEQVKTNSVNWFIFISYLYYMEYLIVVWALKIMFIGAKHMLISKPDKGIAKF
jgi:hypothetical protein